MPHSDTIKKLLNKDINSEKEKDLTEALERISRLELQQLQHIYNSDNAKNKAKVIDLLSRGDIHQGVIVSSLNKDGIPQDTIIEGR